MKKYIVLSFLLAFGAGKTARAQELQNVWLAIDTTIKGDTIAFPTVDTGYIATPKTIYITTDGGKTFVGRALPSITSGTSLLQMCWPTAQNGYLLFSTGANSSVLVMTSNAGVTWTYSSPVGLPLSHISFPTASFGYATGELNPVGTGYFIARTTNAGASWTQISANNLSLGPILFRTPAEGMYLYYDGSDVPQVTYTFDSLKHQKNAAAIPFTVQGQIGNFVDWNDDGSWIVQYQGIFRSSDTGQHWDLVLPDDPTGNDYGVISSACFYGARGFAFADNAVDFETTDFGATWHRFTSTDPYGTGPATSCAMPSDTVAYTTAAGSTNTVLLKLFLPPSAGVTPVSAPNMDRLEITQSGGFLLFTTDPEATARTIHIYDVLGRELTALELEPMNTGARLAPGTLNPGSYFARLGSAMVKFAVW